MKTEFKVLRWDFNSDSLIYYDVLPYLRECYAERKKIAKRKSSQKAIEKDPRMFRHLGLPTTREQFRDFIETESQYQFWSRCEYEMICTGWPERENSHKLDIHEQIMMNIDVITDILWDEIARKR